MAGENQRVLPRQRAGLGSCCSEHSGHGAIGTWRGAAPDGGDAPAAPAPLPAPSRAPGSAPVRAAAAPPVAPATLRLRFPPPPRRAPRSAALEHRDWRRGGAGSAHQQPALRPVRRAVPAPDTALGSLARPRHSSLGEPVLHPLRSLRGRYRPRAPQPAGTRLPAPLPPLSPRRSAQPAHRRRSLARRLMNMQIQTRGRLMVDGQVINILVSARGLAGARPAPAAG